MGKKDSRELFFENYGLMLVLFILIIILIISLLFFSKIGYSKIEKINKDKESLDLLSGSLGVTLGDDSFIFVMKKVQFII